MLSSVDRNGLMEDVTDSNYIPTPLVYLSAHPHNHSETGAKFKIINCLKRHQKITDFSCILLGGTIFLVEENVGKQTPYINLGPLCDLRRGGSHARFFTSTPYKELLSYGILMVWHASIVTVTTKSFHFITR